VRIVWHWTALAACGTLGLVGCTRPFGASTGLTSSYTSENYGQFAKDYQARSIVAPGMGLDNNLEPSTTHKIGAAVEAVPAKVGDSLKAGTTKLVSWTTSDATATAAPEATPVTTGWFSKKKEATPELCVATARLYEKAGNFDAAAEQYQKALKKAPSDVPALLGYAHLLDHQNKLAEATTQYQKAIKANPKESAAYNDLGLCLARRGSVSDAGKAVAKAVELQPDRVLYRNNLAKLLVEQNRPDEALAQLRAVHAEAISHYNLAIMLDEHKQDSLAEAHFRQALELDPSFAQARDWTFRMAARTGNPAPAPAYSHPISPAAINNFGMSSAPTMTPRPGSYGIAPEPGASQYLRPDLAANSGPALTGNAYDAPAASANNVSNRRYVHPSDPSNPPTPESIGNYQPSTDAELRFLPPVN
jgi:Tfp pilus assembly protein PilF